MGILHALGIYEYAIENAVAECEEKFDALLLSDRFNGVIDKFVNSVKEFAIGEDFTNEAIRVLFEIACDEIRDVYPNIGISCYVNGGDSHFDIAELPFVEEASATGLSLEEVVTVFNSGFFEWFDERNRKLLYKKKEILLDVCRSLIAGYECCYYENYAELGEDNSDNGCRDEDDTDEEFGRFLVDAYASGNSSTVYVELTDGMILAIPLAKE